ncbi:MAG: hypothetical protein ABIS06_05315, partial [Vicinamibacterales bacterium]
IWFANSIASGAFVWTGEPETPAEMTNPSAVASWHLTHLTEGLAKADLSIAVLRGRSGIRDRSEDE